MIVVAVTGGVACGKSSVSQALENELPKDRVARLDCDAAVAELLQDPDVLELIREMDTMTDGGSLFQGDRLEKGALRKRAFENSDFREKLEAVLHPRVLDRTEQFREESKSFAEMLLVEVPLLYEVAFPIVRDLDLVVAASRETQRQRLLRDRNVESKLAEQIIGAQLPIEEKIEMGDIVVWNDCHRDVLDEQVRHLAERCLPLFN